MIRLIKPDVKFEDSFRTAFEEMRSESDRDAWIYLGPDFQDFFKIRFSEYVERLLTFECSPPSHFVCGSTYWAINNDEEVVGRIGLRHELNDFLRKAGGHIGYITRPSYRKKGVATEMLCELLRTDRAQQIKHLLVTCDDGNPASEKTITNNGGILENVLTYEVDRPPKKRFWIHLDDKISVQSAPHDFDINIVKEFYGIFRYSGPVKKLDDIILSTLGERVIGVVRLTNENNVWLLRGMFIHNDFQRKGIGIRMLEHFKKRMQVREISNAYLICGPHLDKFYGTIGFKRMNESEAPEFLVERKSSYLSKHGEQNVLRFKSS